MTWFCQRYAVWDKPTGDFIREEKARLRPSALACVRTCVFDSQRLEQKEFEECFEIDETYY